MTTWTRLEPRARGADMRPSLEGRVHDPLWLLGRQWQVGEFQGEDAGSPVVARLRGRSDRVTAWRAGRRVADPGAAPAPAQSLDGGVPLEALVEQEDPAPNARLAVEAGTHALRLLAAAGLGAYRDPLRAAYPVALPGPATDPDGSRYLTVVAGRALDGELLAAALREPLAGDDLPAGFVVADGERAALVSVLRGWLTWFDDLVRRPPAGQATWQPERMEYGFAAAARVDGAPLVLEVAEYVGGHLDWHAFAVGGGVDLPAAASSEDVVATSLAAPASYPGMPARRWWQFEDARVDFGGIEAAPEDLARMLLAEFATVYGNDWYLLPFDVPVGSLTTVHSLVVLDTFGERTLLDRVSDPEWSMFELSRVDAGPGTEHRATRLLVPPSLGASLEGEPVEDVLLARDEMANLAWAIERVVEGVAGDRVDRFTAWQARRAAEGDAASTAPEPAAGELLAYRLMTEVPDHWVPLVPEEVEPGRVRLRRGAVRRPTPEGEVSVPPRGRVLIPGQPLALFEEEVPREGANVVRAWQHARWIDGSTHVWLGRRKRPGRGGSSSGLRFDRLIRADGPGQDQEPDQR